MSNISPNSKDAESPVGKFDWDPVFLNARREAIAICLIFILMLTWTIAVCYFDGYVFETGDLPVLFGMPRWVVLGVFIPWLVADIVVYWFCFYFMKEDPLDDAQENSDSNLEEENV